MILSKVAIVSRWPKCISMLQRPCPQVKCLVGLTIANENDISSMGYIGDFPSPNEFDCWLMFTHLTSLIYEPSINSVTDNLAK